MEDDISDWPAVGEKQSGSRKHYVRVFDSLQQLKLYWNGFFCESYGASTSQHNKLLYDNTQYFLALALADRAFWGIKSPEELWQLEILPGENELILQWKDSAKDLPILRNATMQHGISVKPLPKRTFDRIIKSVMNLSGFFGSATVHAIRRYLGEKVNG